MWAVRGAASPNAPIPPAAGSAVLGAVSDVVSLPAAAHELPAAAVTEAEQGLCRREALAERWATTCNRLFMADYAPIPLPAQWATDADFSVCNTLLKRVADEKLDAKEAKKDAEKAYEFHAAR